MYSCCQMLASDESSYTLAQPLESLIPRAGQQKEVELDSASVRSSPSCPNKSFSSANVPCRSYSSSNVPPPLHIQARTGVQRSLAREAASTENHTIKQERHFSGTGWKIFVKQTIGQSAKTSVSLSHPSKSGISTSTPAPAHFARLARRYMERRLPHRRCMSPSSRAAPVRSSVRTPRVQTGL